MDVLVPQSNKVLEYLGKAIEELGNLKVTGKSKKIGGILLIKLNEIRDSVEWLVNNTMELVKVQDKQQLEVVNEDSNSGLQKKEDQERQGDSETRDNELS